jgi:hypothetical protein
MVIIAGKMGYLRGLRTPDSDKCERPVNMPLVRSDRTRTRACARDKNPGK